jgi:lipid-A-disaccharide synthase
MGLWEVIRHLGSIRKHLKLCKADILNWNPDIVIPIDHPGFNMRIAAFTKNHGFKVAYFIAPKAWAWKKKRAFTLAKVTDLVLSILPFEPAFFAPYQAPVRYIGNPLWDQISAFQADPAFLQRNALEKPVIALLPGSRRQEIVRILPTMIEAALRLEDCEVAIACAPDFPPEFYQRFIAPHPSIRLLSGETYQLLSHAQAALVASGTATLEAALLNCPQVVCYRTSALTYHAAKRLLKIKYISLVNLIMNRLVVRERIQNEMNPEILEQDLRRLLEPDHALQLKADYEALRMKMGNPGAAQRAASEILKLV